MKKKKKVDSGGETGDIVVVGKLRGYLKLKRKGGWFGGGGVKFYIKSVVAMGRAGFLSGSGLAGLLRIWLGPGRAIKCRAGPGSGFFFLKSPI